MNINLKRIKVYTAKKNHSIRIFKRFLCAIKMHIMHKTKMLMLLKIRSNIKY